MTPDGICPGSCNSTYRRRTALYEEAVRKYDAAMEGRAKLAALGLPVPPEPEPPEKPDIKPWAGLPTWCAHCTTTLHTQLLELDDLAALVQGIPPLAKPAESAAPKVSGSRTAPSPSARMDDIAELGEWLDSWEAVAREEDTARPRRGYLATQMTTVTAWLAAHFGPLITNPDFAKDFGEEIRRWHRTLAARAAAGRMQRHMKKPCPRCKLYTLWATMGDDYIRCINEECGRMLTKADFDGLSDAA